MLCTGSCPTNRGKAKAKEKVKVKEKQKPFKRKRRLPPMGRKKALVAEAIAALTYMTQRSAQGRQKERGKEKRSEVTLLLLNADAPPCKKSKSVAIT